MHYCILKIVGTLTRIATVAIICFGAIACTRQETVRPTEIPLSTRAPALTQTMAAIRLLPTFTSPPPTPTLTPLPLYTLEPTAKAELRLIQSIFRQEMGWNDLANQFSTQPDLIYIAAYYTVDEQSPNQIARIRQTAESRMPSALCAIRDAGINMRNISLRIWIGAERYIPSSFDYCFETEALVRMNCGDSARVEVSELATEGVCLPVVS